MLQVLTIGEAKQYFNIQNTFDQIGYDVCANEIVVTLVYHKQELECSLSVCVMMSPRTVGLTFMNIGSVFPENFDYVVPLEDALTGLEYDKEEVDMLTERFLEQNIGKNWCKDANISRQSIEW